MLCLMWTGKSLHKQGAATEASLPPQNLIPPGAYREAVQVKCGHKIDWLKNIRNNPLKSFFSYLFLFIYYVFVLPIVDFHQGKETMCCHEKAATSKHVFFFFSHYKHGDLTNDNAFSTVDLPDGENKPKQKLIACSLTRYYQNNTYYTTKTQNIGCGSREVHPPGTSPFLVRRVKL